MPQTSIGGLTGNLTIGDLDGLGFASDTDVLVHYRQKLTANDVRHKGTGTASLGTWAASSAIASGQLVPSVTSSGTAFALNHAYFVYTGGANISRWNTSFPFSSYVTAVSLQNNTNKMPYCIDFMYYGTQLEIVGLTVAGYNWRVTVDGETVGGIASSATNGYLPLTFTSAGPHRIRLETTGIGFGGLVIGPTDTVWKPQVSGPRVIVAGDSFTGGTGASYGSASHWVRTFANTLKLDDVWSSGVGGTGYLAPGSAVKMYDRIADVTSYSPDVVLWAMGHNDTAYTQAQIQAEAARCYAAVAAANPNVTQVVLAPFWGPQPATTTLTVRDGVKAAATAAGLPFVDLLEMPLDGTAAATTLTAGLTATTATATLGALVPLYSTIAIDGANGTERFHVTAISGSGPYTATVSPVAAVTHPSGSNVTEVGQSFFNGSGWVGATTGNGNSDILIGADGTHPTQAGHDALGVAVATQIARYVFPAA